MNAKRRSIGSLVSAASLIVVLVGCSGGEVEEAGSMEGMAEHASQQMNDVFSGFAHQELVVLEASLDTPEEFDEGFRGLYTGYLALQRAFGASDETAVSEAAAQMQTALKGVPHGALSGEGLEAWVSHRKVFEQALSDLTAGQDLEEQRRHFSHISEAMYCGLKSFDVGTVQANAIYCSMAFGSTGAYWINDTEEIQNPYYGEAMLRCGEVRERLGG